MEPEMKTKHMAAMLTMAGASLYAGQSAVAQKATVTVHLYDLVDISRHTLDAAAREAARVLATADVEVVWQQGSSGAPEAHESDQSASTGVWRQPFDARDYLVVRIVRGPPARSLPGALGFALPHARSGAQATVFYDRIEPVGRSGVISVSVLLGHAMAHEIGHVLLGTTEHSPDGIMKARWGRLDYQRAAMGSLGFTPSQRAAIREQRLARLARVSASIAVLFQRRARSCRAGGG
jgi:hypothetical protein